MQGWFQTGWMILLCLSLISCANNSGNQSAKVPEDFRIVFGEGGGFSGRWTGHTIESNGSVAKWEGYAAEENPAEAGQLDGDAVALVWQKLQESSYFDTDMQEKGNMTRMIRVTANEETHEVFWVNKMGTDAAENPLDELLAYCRDQVAPSEDK